jgi:hypothetical protein
LGDSEEESGARVDTGESAKCRWRRVLGARSWGFGDKKSQKLGEGKEEGEGRVWGEKGGPAKLVPLLVLLHPSGTPQS